MGTGSQTARLSLCDGLWDGFRKWGAGGAGGTSRGKSTRKGEGSVSLVACWEQRAGMAKEVGGEGKGVPVLLAPILRGTGKGGDCTDAPEPGQPGWCDPGSPTLRPRLPASQLRDSAISPEM